MTRGHVLMLITSIKFVDILSVAFAISVVIEPICSICFARVCFHIQRAMGGFSGGEGVRGLNPPKFFLTPSRKCLTPLEFRFTPLALFGLPFHAPSKDQEWHIAYDLPPT